MPRSTATAIEGSGPCTDIYPSKNRMTNTFDDRWLCGIRTDGVRICSPLVFVIIVITMYLNCSRSSAARGGSCLKISQTLTARQMHFVLGLLGLQTLLTHDPPRSRLSWKESRRKTTCGQISSVGCLCRLSPKRENWKTEKWSRERVIVVYTIIRTTSRRSNTGRWCLP